MFKKFAKEYDKISWIIRLVLVIIPVTAWITGALYRISKGRLLFGLLYFFTFAFVGIGWIIDIVTVALKGKITFLA